MNISRWFLFIWIFVAWINFGYADFIEVRRTANVYKNPDRTSERIQRIDLSKFETRPKFTIALDELVNGYINIVLPNGESGWIYKSFGRVFKGDIPDNSGYTTSDEIGDVDSEIEPDITDAIPHRNSDPSLPPISHPGVQIYMFSIGQADSLLVVGPAPERKTLLVDLGEALTGGTDANYVVVRDRIKSITGRDSVNYFVLTHFHGDHAGHPARGPCTAWNAKFKSSGIFALLDDTARPFRIDTWIDRGDNGQNYTEKLSQSHCGVINSMSKWIADGRVGRRESAVIGNSQISLGQGTNVDIVVSDGKVFSGDAGAMAFAVKNHGQVYAEDQPASENDYSIGMELSVGEFEIFLGGDLSGADAANANVDFTLQKFGDSKTIYTNVEKYLVRHWQTIGRESAVEIYRANHHGSSHSSSPEFAKKLNPMVVLYSAGGGYSHPDPETVQRFQKADQFVTTAVSAKSWPKGFPQKYGSVLGEINVKVSDGGDVFQINDYVYKSRTDTEEATR